MTVSPREELSALLRNVRSDGSFSTRRTAPVDDLAINVEDVGELRLPVTAAQAKQLRLVARPAKYGHGEKTMLDRRVRDTWEVPRSRVRVDRRRWNLTLRPMLDLIRDDLALPPSSRLTAQLHSMLVYEPGQFFAPHQDSEKNDEMIGTLVVMLPARSSGGDLVIEHRKQSVRYSGSATVLTFVAFYADTRHEVLPVETGYRVVLAYNLLLMGDTAATRTVETQAETAADLLARHFAHVPAPRWHGDRQAMEPPDRLVYCSITSTRSVGFAGRSSKVGTPVVSRRCEPPPSSPSATSRLLTRRSTRHASATRRVLLAGDVEDGPTGTTSPPPHQPTSRWATCSTRR